MPVRFHNPMCSGGFLGRLLQRTKVLVAPSQEAYNAGKSRGLGNPVLLQVQVVVQHEIEE